MDGFIDLKKILDSGFLQMTFDYIFELSFVCLYSFIFMSFKFDCGWAFIFIFFVPFLNRTAVLELL